MESGDRGERFEEYSPTMRASESAINIGTTNPARQDYAVFEDTRVIRPPTDTSACLHCFALDQSMPTNRVQAIMTKWAQIRLVDCTLQYSAISVSSSKDTLCSRSLTEARTGAIFGVDPQGGSSGISPCASRSFFRPRPSSCPCTMRKIKLPNPPS